MARRILAWECRYCGEIKRSEKICIRHEKTCLSNPEARNCIFCKHSFVSIGDPEIFSHKKKELMCKHGFRCSKATSAACDKFERSNGVQGSDMGGN